MKLFQMRVSNGTFPFNAHDLCTKYKFNEINIIIHIKNATLQKFIKLMPNKLVKCIYLN